MMHCITSPYTKLSQIPHKPKKKILKEKKRKNLIGRNTWKIMNGSLVVEPGACKTL